MVGMAMGIVAGVTGDAVAGLAACPSSVGVVALFSLASTPGINNICTGIMYRE